MKVFPWHVVGAVSVGAIVGALSRFGIQRWLNFSSISPMGTFVVNVVGSFVLGIVVGAFAHRLQGPLFYGVTAGFCGSLTTFSSLVMELFEMLRMGEPVRAAIYILASLILGLVGLAVGYVLGVRLT